MATDSELAWTTQEFEARLRSLSDHYHIHHPFHVNMYAGQLNREQIQGWVANRYYYQINIPRKDAAIIANCPNQEVRRRWVRRILTHDGADGEEGGIEAWLRLGEACGLTRDELSSNRHALPGVRFAVDAYVNFARRASWQEAVCSSLTELFAPAIHQQRLVSWPDHYPWIESRGLDYFRNRLINVHGEAEEALAITLNHFMTRRQQQRALDILHFKLEVLWSILDAIYMAYWIELPPFHHLEEHPE
jgi:pyrroloquinoline-quinone synthase